MNEAIIACPKCANEIKLTESLAAPLVGELREKYVAHVNDLKQQHKNEIATKEKEIDQREKSLREQREEVLKAERSIDETVYAKLQKEREIIIAEEAKKARLALAMDLKQKESENAELHNILKDRNEKLAEAQRAQADLIRKERELDDAKREMDLTVEKRVQDSISLVREQAKKNVEEEFKLRVLEKDHIITSMQTQIEELKRRSEQGSQQLQGEVQELELESTLRATFPQDMIEPVPKGEFGGDVLQRVIGPLGRVCGTILWESKRTKNFNDDWLAKLREDQRSAKAEIALIVSQVLPKGVDTFGLVDGVWITNPKCAIPVALTIRHSLIELSNARQAGEGQQSKMELIYQYLTGTGFRQRIQAIVEKFSDMQADLEKERKVTMRLWAKRDEQIRGVIDATAGMYGDLQGIAGKTFLEIECLDIKMLEDKTLEELSC